ncbi:MAG: hypothetical protein K2I64_00555 [Muribaculaceae bacterium]|nr:hypothetical protein [Muribaculaceae bacterium]
MIGVDNEPNKNINEGTTDHFLVVVGIGHDEKGNFILVYDNATRRAEGYSDQNKMYLNTEMGVISGRTQTPYSQNPARHPNIVSQVRKSISINPRKK